MKPSLQLKLAPQLALTPQLQQSIRLLQLSTLELNQELEQALADNPLLERIDDPLGDCVRIAANGGLDDGRVVTMHERDAAQSKDEGATDDASGWNDDDRGSVDDDRNYDWGGEGIRAAATNDEDEREYPQLASAGRSLREHLGEQL